MLALHVVLHGPARLGLAQPREEAPALRVGERGEGVHAAPDVLQVAAADSLRYKNEITLTKSLTKFFELLPHLVAHNRVDRLQSLDAAQQQHHAVPQELVLRGHARVERDQVGAQLGLVFERLLARGVDAVKAQVGSVPVRLEMVAQHRLYVETLSTALHRTNKRSFASVCSDVIL